MGIASVAIQLARKGLKPIINEAQRTLSYATKQGIQKTLLFDTAGKVKYWSSVTSETGAMKVYQNLSDTLSKRVSKVEEFQNYSKLSKTTTITTEKDFNTLLPSKQTVLTENHITGINRTKVNQGIKSQTQKQHTSTNINQTEIPKMKYKKAKTLQEAKEYARTHLGIERFDVPDLEIANQINYSLTKAYNKTGGKINKFFDEVSYSHIQDENCPALTRIKYGDGSDKLEKVTLILNSSFINNIDRRLSIQITDLAKNGQLGKNNFGKDIINLCTDYRYNNTINRYYRLYKQGKLTQKGKLDFSILLSKGREEERFLLGHRNSLEKTLKTKFGVDVSRLQEQEYNTNVKKLLVDIKNTYGYEFTTKDNLFNTNGATGLDYVILHEEGHVIHLAKSDINNVHITRKFTDSESKIAREISEYATEDSSEYAAEYIAGVLSNDKYSQPVKELFKIIF